MGGLSIVHFALTLVLLVPFAIVSFLPLFIVPRGPNRFGAPADSQTFPSAFVRCMKKYADFGGRGRRSEYWWFRLAVALIVVIAMIVDHSEGLARLISLAFLLPDMAAAGRRLHDLNRSAWWLLLGLTGIGVISLVILLAWPAKKDDQAQVF